MLRRKIAGLLAVLCLTGSLSGCRFGSTEELYCLPALPESHAALQQAVDRVLLEETEYASPSAGDHRQALQLEDLDGDGVEEAVGFFRTLDAEARLLVCVFTLQGDRWEELLRIAPEGTGFRQVEYADLDGNGSRELILGCSGMGELKLLQIYSIRGGKCSLLAQTDYLKYLAADLNGDGCRDVLAVRSDVETECMEALLYTMSGDGEIGTKRARLSAGAGELERLRLTQLPEGGVGVAAESVLGTGLVTDLLVWRYSGLANVTADAETGVSTETCRSSQVYAADVNGDGVIDVPQPEAMPENAEGTVYYRTVWYDFDRYGKKAEVMITYHNFADGWYLELDSSWADQVSVRRQDTPSGERCVVFSAQVNGQREDWLSVYALSGESRFERAKAGDRIQLDSVGNTVYAAECTGSGVGWTKQITQRTIQDSFHVIYSDWESEDS